MNVLLYFVWDASCLRKQRDQVSACSFSLLKSSGFIYVITMHSDLIEICRGSIKSFSIVEANEKFPSAAVALPFLPIYFSQEKRQPPSCYSTQIWVPWYQVLFEYLDTRTLLLSNLDNRRMSSCCTHCQGAAGRFKCSIQVCHSHFWVTVASFPAPHFQHSLLLPAP